jgi:hypothetical protein
VATDVDPGYLDASWAPNLQVRRHDVTTEDFAAGSFDLIHVRYLMVYLPGREAVLTRAARWLAPGGWLVVEEPDAFTSDSSPYPAFRRPSSAPASACPAHCGTRGTAGLAMNCGSSASRNSVRRWLARG